MKAAVRRSSEIYLRAGAPSRRGGARSRLLNQLRCAQKAWEVDKVLKKLGPPRTPTECNMGIAAWGRARDWRRSVQRLEGMQRDLGFAPTTASFNAAISACGKAGEWQRALKLLRALEKMPGVAPDVISYGAAISACATGKESPTALALLAEMEQRGLRPNLITFNAALSACEKARAWRAAVELLDEMEQMELQPNLISYNTVLSACEKAREWERAVDLIERMEGRGVSPDAQSYSVAIFACVHGLGAPGRPIKAWVLAWRLFQKMEARGLQPRLRTCNAVMRCLVSAAQFDKGFELLARLRRHDALATRSYPTHLALLKACRESDDAAGAERVQAQMDALGLRKTLAAEAIINTTAGEERLLNGPQQYGKRRGEHALDAAVDRLFRRVHEKTSYTPEFGALPFAFVQRATEAEMAESLRFHAEKKALALLLLRRAEDLDICINFSVCADCNAFLAAAAAALGRRIRVREPSREHVFDAHGRSGRVVPSTMQEGSTSKASTCFD